MKKRLEGLKAILPLVYSAVRKRKMYPSKAEDQGTSSRNAKHLTQIVLNLLNGASEIADQMAASAVYGYDSFISSHSFTNIYVVDFFKYVKSGGKSLQEDAVMLDQEEIDEDEENLSDENVDEWMINSGYGQQPKPIQKRLSKEEGNKITVKIVKDIDNYIHRGSQLKVLSAYLYKSLITKVRKREIRNRSKVKYHAGQQPSLTYEFDPEHPQAHSHVQRLRKKPLIPKFVGKKIPNDPGL